MDKWQEHIPNPKARQIFALIRRQGTVSKLGLIEQSGIPVSTVTRMLDELLRSGLILQEGLGESTGGRRPILYRINPSYGYVFGLDVSRTCSRLILCDLALNKIGSARWEMTERMTPDVFLRQVAAAAEAMLQANRIPRGSLIGMGIGAVGPLDRTAGKILQPLYFPADGWSNVEIRRYFEECLGIPVLLDNGANTAILAEYWADEQKYRHLLYIHAGVGLRSAMMSDGRVVYGAVDMEGSVGQMIIQTDGVPHREPGRPYGCLESYVSIHALEQAAQSRLKQGRKSLLRELAGSPEQVSFSHLSAALAAEDPLVTELFTQAATYFGIGLANLLNILHPEKVILGGPLITGNDLVFDIATQIALKNTYYYPAYRVHFSRGKLGDEALALGAAVMVIDRLSGD